MFLFIKSILETEQLISMNKFYLLSLITFLFQIFIPQKGFTQNSTCADATIVSVGTHEVTEFAGNGAVFQGATAAAWYRFEPTTAGVFTVSSCEGGGDTRLVIMLLADCANAANLQILNSAEDNCADGKGGNTASTIEVVATAGISYVIYWDNGQSADGFTWNLSFESENNPSEGSTCETAISITTGTHEVSALTGIGAAFTDAVSAKWYQYRPEKTNVLAINSCESNVNTRLFVFEAGCATAQIIAQNDDGCGTSGAAVLTDNVIVDSGKVYYIYWDDHSSKEGFTFQLDLVELPSGIVEPPWAKGIQLYPNPASHYLVVDYVFQENKNLTMTIFNSLGQVVLIEDWTSFSQGQIEIPIVDLYEGIYFLRLNSAEGQVTRRFVVSR